VPLLWGGIKVVRSTSTRMHLINDFLFIILGRRFVCVMLIESKKKHQVWGDEDKPYI
jgi:hypothetical protein